MIQNAETYEVNVEDTKSGAVLQFRIVNRTDNAILQAVETLKNGDIILYPTDTLYGLGVDPFQKKAVAKLRALKGREDSSPFIVLVDGPQMLMEYAEITPLASAMLHRFQSESLTVILQATGDSLSNVQNEDGGIAFRVPSSVYCRELVHRFETPIVSTSANYHDSKCLSTIPEILEQLKGEGISLVINAGKLENELPSTIVDVRGKSAVLVRKGTIPKSSIKPFMSML